MIKKKKKKMKILNLIKNLIRFKAPYKLEIVKVMPQREEIVPMQVEHTINIPTDERF